MTSDTMSHEPDVTTSTRSTIDNQRSGIVRRDAVISEELQHSELHPVLKKVYANRGITELKQVDYRLNKLIDYSLLKDIDRASQVVADAVIQQQHILVIGDFDADGATSCAVMLRSLHAFGLHNVDYLVPNRFDFGYGLSPQIVDVAATMNGNSRPDLIITVDNGISSNAGVERATELGIPVVITDHHLAGDVLPEALAIVNPNQPGCDFPEKTIAGVGVAFYLMLAVRAVLREKNWFGDEREEPNMAAFLDLVALGTVADVVPLDENNRILVECGLQRIRGNKACAGINALLTIAGKSIEACSSSDFGFIIGPRLNAAGRLDDMSVGIECLLSDDYTQALQYATVLNQMNLQRRQIEGEMLEQAFTLLDRQLSSLQHTDIPDALSLYDEQWHQGVVGLLASRIKEKFHRPVIAFADAGNGELKGSGRSIPGMHIRDVLDAVSKKHVGLIEKFGGHAMAAGLTLRQENFESFKSAFAEQAGLALRAEDLDDIKETDGAIDSRYLSIDVCEQLKYASPWGQLFPEPEFDDSFRVLNWRIVGGKHLKLELLKDDTGECYDAIAFNKTDADLPVGDDDIHIVYRLDVNEFRGKRTLQLIVTHIEAL
jgi:single-stranded-DNA-specific exonuclease